MRPGFRALYNAQTQRPGDRKPINLQDHPSPEAKRQILNAVSILHFPYRIGRESRTKLINGRVGRIERPKFGNEAPNNDLHLVDSGTRMNISREHCSFIEDAGSYKTPYLDRFIVLSDAAGAEGTSIPQAVSRSASA
ncbi:MAG: hypothetical protein VBE63_28155 [Lamprobacter sp.]|uniref:hypothetical protein n=1 Tax=Lamprobacter sp. TaxID=3100796 RepID=UPI002B25B3B9|nr:hypothetical protein [Lamprobacter sp.]MEA3643772.1 hypothetical protein [Lamprobacter sp.]